MIAAIGPDLQPDADARVIDGRGKLLMPGLINGHFHSPGNFNKGALDDMPLELFMLYEVPPFDCPPVSPRLNYVRTLLGAAEMLKTGVTAVHDDPFYVPIVNMELIDAAMQAYADSGIRATVSINMPNVIEYEKYPFLFDLLPEAFRARMRESPLLSTADLLALYRDFIARWHTESSGIAARFGLVLRPAAREGGLSARAFGAERHIRSSLQHAHPRNAASAGAGGSTLRQIAGEICSPAWST